MANNGSHGELTLVRTSEYLQGTVVGVQGQQMLVCAQDLACLLKSLRSSPQEPSTQKTGPALVCS